jgi:hypothetical protein
MKLILTTSDSGAGGLLEAKLAEFVIPFVPKLVWGQPPSQTKTRRMFSYYAEGHDSPGSDWRDFADKGVDAVELWADPDPNSQLTLIWLLDNLINPEPSNVTLVQPNVPIGSCTPEELAKWQPQAVEIHRDHLEAAGRTWQAYCQPTPQAWFNLLSADVSVLPQLGQTVIELLEELPMPDTGLGATEMLILGLISARTAGPFDVFPGHKKANERRVFGYWEVGELLDWLAHCPVPAVSGLGEGPFTPAMHQDRERYLRYQRSKLELTALGKAVLARTEDFSRHNPVHRWWGGTELSHGHLWRYDPATRDLIAP